MEPMVLLVAMWLVTDDEWLMAALLVIALLI